VLLDKTEIDASEESAKPIFRTEEKKVKMETSDLSVVLVDSSTSQPNLLKYSMEQSPS
jgi:hypothetical protein